MAPRANTRPPKGQLTGKPDPTRAGLPAWSTFAEEAAENVLALRWPASIDTNDAISKSGQPSALLRLIKAPVRNYRIALDPGAYRPERAAQIAGQLGVPVAATIDDDTPPEPRNGRPVRGQILDRVLRAPTLGHSVMEIVGDLDGTDWNLSDLIYLSPRTLSHWQFRDGTTDVEYIEQQMGARPVRLPANRLAIFRYGLDPDMPYGESILRPIYPHWLSKDRLMKVALIAAQRNGMGVPWTEMPENSTGGHTPDYQALMEGVAAGEDVGLTYPAGAQFHLQGVTGSTYDVLADIKYHDEQMARILGGQVIQLGTTATGNRALGDTMADLLWGARDSLVEWACDELTDQVVRRHAIWNGMDPDAEDLPRLIWERPEAVEPLTAQDWGALRTAGLIDDSPEARAEFARRYGVPIATEQPATPIAASRAVAAARDTGVVPGVPQATRPLTEIEDASRWPFARIQTAWVAARDTLVALWRRVRSNMIAASVAEIAALDDLAERVDDLHDLAQAAAAGAVTDRVLNQAATVAVGLADNAAAAVVDAAALQGVAVVAIDPDYDTQAVREARAVSKTLAFTVADQVARRADMLAAPDADSRTVARLVADDMATLTDALLEDVAGSTATKAQNAGQAAQAARAWGDGQVRSAYYSSLLDGSTCTECGARDGHEYQDMTQVRQDFPVGGYRACLGRERCRCTWVLVMADETPATVGI